MLEKLQDKTFVTGIVAAIVAVFTGFCSLFGVQFVADEAFVTNLITLICTAAALAALVKQYIDKKKAQAESADYQAKLQAANARLVKVGLKEV